MGALVTPTVFFMSEAQALRFNPEDFGGKWLLIGITDPTPTGKPAPLAYPFEAQFARVERLSFYDTNDQDVLDDTDVQRVHEAIQQATQEKWHIAIHCYMGVSRSGAVAKYISSHTVDYTMRSYHDHNEALFWHLGQLAVLPNAKPYRVYKYPRGHAYRCDDCDGLGCNHCEDGKRYTNA